MIVTTSISMTPTTGDTASSPFFYNFLFIDYSSVEFSRFFLVTSIASVGTPQPPAGGRAAGKAGHHRGDDVVTTSISMTPTTGDTAESPSFTCLPL
jgi:hypothetical protein